MINQLENKYDPFTIISNTIKSVEIEKDTNSIFVVCKHTDSLERLPLPVVVLEIKGYIFCEFEAKRDLSLRGLRFVETFNVSYNSNRVYHFNYVETSLMDRVYLMRINRDTKEIRRTNRLNNVKPDEIEK